MIYFANEFPGFKMENEVLTEMFFGTNHFISNKILKM